MKRELQENVINYYNKRKPSQRLSLELSQHRPNGLFAILRDSLTGKIAPEPCSIVRLILNCASISQEYIKHRPVDKDIPLGCSLKTADGYLDQCPAESAPPV